MLDDGPDPHDLEPRRSLPGISLRTLGVVAAVCGVAFVAVAALVASGALDALDSWWNTLLAGHRGTVLVWAAQALTVVGDTTVTATFRVAGAVWLLWRRRFPAFWAWAIASVLSPVLVEIAKAAFARPRPADFVWSAGGWAFPSGHAAAAVTNAALVVLLLVPARHRRVAIVCGAVWAASMAMARNVLGAHWLSDVVGGILLGLSVTCGVVAAVFAVSGRIRGRGVREEGDAWDERSPSQA